ncbi:hypothetical protein B0F90DRAFT_983969 [Multifurca ochricompacta]|uniref:Uncharacterized protein n=1 Tax=Multifurca ochricompacta TaxID=376703 RepID=A0AAD4QLQ5_9AGAM|nr:hypothetical protein B0F90DRAFT_983969 [Multifurca ochricompacta]
MATSICSFWLSTQLVIEAGQPRPKILPEVLDCLPDEFCFYIIFMFSMIDDVAYRYGCCSLDLVFPIWKLVVEEIPAQRWFAVLRTRWKYRMNPRISLFCFSPEDEDEDENSRFLLSLLTRSHMSVALYLAPGHIAHRGVMPVNALPLTLRNPCTSLL